MTRPDSGDDDSLKAAANLWRHTLEKIDSTFGRICYLASLRNANTGLYEHFGLSQRFDALAADQVLRDSHIRIFNQWLSLGLQEQKLDVEEHLGTVDADIASVIATWVRLTPYQSVMPAGTRTVERDLFNADLHRILEMLKFEHAVSSPDPDA